jgi:hypothetical protein
MFLTVGQTFNHRIQERLLWSRLWLNIQDDQSST